MLLYVEQEGLAALVEPELLKPDPSVLDKDLEKVKDLLMQYAGAMQVSAFARVNQYCTWGRTFIVEDPVCL